MNTVFFIFLLVIQFAIPLYSANHKAVCVVPVADLVGESVQKNNPLHPQKSYFSLPIAQKKFDTPARLHQLLFNEIVEIKEIRGQEARIEIPNLFYETTDSSKPQAEYWTLRSNVQPLQELTKKGINLALFPLPLTRNKDHFEKALHNTISITSPFFDPVTQKIYSAGTRFVVAHNTDTHVTAHIFDARHGRIGTTDIPKEFCLLHEGKNYQDRVQDFVAVVSSWAHTKCGFIPYVWGGCSVGKLCSNEQFSEEKGIFSRKELTSHLPIAGLDCTGLVARAAHLAGIPYFYKNSFTLAKHLKPLGKDEKVSEGDLIWIPGHVMVVSSLKKATLVEARHYSHGYGKVHEIPLAQQFQGMDSYEKLAAAFFAKKPLKRLDRVGTVAQALPEFKILRLSSIWS